MNKVDILGVKIDAITQTQVLERVESFLHPNNPAFAEASVGKQIITANPEIVLKAWQNEAYRNLINNATVVVPDGIGLLWAAKFLSLKSENILTSLIQMMATGASLIFAPEYCKEVLPERIAGVDLMEKICEQASQKNWKIYLLGGEERIAQKTGEVLKSKYLSLDIVGAEAGPTLNDTRYLIHDNDPETNDSIKSINESKADILFVAMGAPKQDFFIKDILNQLPSVKIAMGVGGAFDFISGKVKRAPIIYQDLGVEWLFRLFNQPWRFFRILNATVKFMWNVIKYKQLLNK